MGARQGKQGKADKQTRQAAYDKYDSKGKEPERSGLEQGKCRKVDKLSTTLVWKSG